MSKIPKLPLQCDTNLSSVSKFRYIAPVLYRNICKKVDGSSLNRQHTFNKEGLRDCVKHDELQTCEVTLPAELRDYPNIKSPALYLTADVGGDVHPDESAGGSVGGRCERHTSVRRTPPSEQRCGRALLHARKQSHAHAADYPQRTACSACHESAKIPSYGCESVSGTSASTFCSLSNPARTTLMTSAVKTKRVRISSSSAAPCPAAGPWRPALVRRRGVAGVEFGGLGVGGIQMLGFEGS